MSARFCHFCHAIHNDSDENDFCLLYVIKALKKIPHNSMFSLLFSSLSKETILTTQKGKK